MNIRVGTPNDLSLILWFIQQKVEFDRKMGAYAGVPGVTEEKLRQTLFGPISFAYVLLAQTPAQPVGFALYEFRYSSFAGQPSLWLDDLFVEQNMRSQGAGAGLMNHLAQIARENDCTHLAWNADARNIRGLSFYDRLGAKITAQTGNRCFLSWVPWAEAGPTAAP
jgi:GNAT superfamily N-acetyltransferase